MINIDNDRNTYKMTNTETTERLLLGPATATNHEITQRLLSTVKLITPRTVRVIDRAIVEPNIRSAFQDI